MNAKYLKSFSKIISRNFSMAYKNNPWQSSSIVDDFQMRKNKEDLNSSCYDKKSDLNDRRNNDEKDYTRKTHSKRDRLMIENESESDCESFDRETRKY